MKRILITGGTGLLGKALIEAKNKEIELIATYVGDYSVNNSDGIRYFKLDIRNREGYSQLFKEIKPHLVIHTASIGSPDYAEKNREETWNVNVEGAKNICELCGQYGAKLVHISSNGIFDGENAPYAEDDPAVPINYYGITKLESEKAVKKSKIPHAIVRPILMYGWPNHFERGNIVTFAITKLKKGESMNVYEDVYSNPLFVQSCAKVIWKIVKEEQFDIFNIAGSERVSIYELVRKTAEMFGLNQNLIKPVRQGFFNELVKRPKDTSYKTEKMEKELDLKPLSLSEGLKLMKLQRNHV